MPEYYNCSTNCSKYLTKRSQIFYFQYRIPSRFNADITHIKKSLRTSSYYEALHLIKTKLTIIEKIQISTDPVKVKGLLTKLADFRTVDRLREHERESYAEGVRYMDRDIRHNLEDGNQIPFEYGGVTFKNDPENLSLILKGLERLEERVYNGALGSQVGNTDTAPLSNASQEPVVLLSQAMDMFVEANKKKPVEGQWTDNYAKEVARHLPIILLALGDVDIKSIEIKDISEALEAIGGMPKGNISPYRQISLEQRFDRIGEVDEEDLISKKNLSEYRKLMQGLFTTFLVSKAFLLETSPIAVSNIQ